MSEIPGSIILNGIPYQGRDLVRLARKLKEESPAAWEQALGAFLLQWTGSADFMQVFTSGSTGAPAARNVSKKAMVASARMTVMHFSLREGSNALLCLSTTTIAGMMMVVRAMVQRMNLITVPPGGSPLEHVTDETGIDFAAMVPAQVYNSLQVPEEALKLQSIGTLIIGGAPLTPVLERKLEMLPGNFFATYGMTETLSHIAVRRLNGPFRSREFTTLPGITPGTDARGCLTAAVPFIEGGTIVTNDMVRMTSAGTFEWLGRADFVINCGGRKLHPEQLERKAAQIIEGNLFVTGLPDEKLGEVPVLVLEVVEIPETNAVTGMLDRLKTVLIREEMPRKILFSRKFAYTESGKINRNESMKTVVRDLD